MPRRSRTCRASDSSTIWASSSTRRFRPIRIRATTGFGLGQVQARFFSNAVHGADQLRQRVAFALLNEFVVSAVEENTPTQLVPYLQILQKDAFGNFRQLMEDVTLSPTMGEYLDMRNNDKANPATDTRRQRELRARADAVVHHRLVPAQPGRNVAAGFLGQSDSHLRSDAPFRISPRSTPAGPIPQSRVPRCRNIIRLISSARWCPSNPITTPPARLC